MNTSTHMTQTELAERWNIGEGTLENWRTKGIGPLYLKLNNRILYRAEDVAVYESESLHKSTSEKAYTGGTA